MKNQNDSDLEEFQRRRNDFKKEKKAEKTAKRKARRERRKERRKAFFNKVSNFVKNGPRILKNLDDSFGSIIKRSEKYLRIALFGFGFYEVKILNNQFEQLQTTVIQTSIRMDESIKEVEKHVQENRPPNIFEESVKVFLATLAVAVGRDIALRLVSLSFFQPRKVEQITQEFQEKAQEQKKLLASQEDKFTAKQDELQKALASKEGELNKKNEESGAMNTKLQKNKKYLKQAIEANKEYAIQNNTLRIKAEELLEETKGFYKHEKKVIEYIERLRKRLDETHEVNAELQKRLDSRAGFWGFVSNVGNMAGNIVVARATREPSSYELQYHFNKAERNDIRRENKEDQKERDRAYEKRFGQASEMGKKALDTAVDVGKKGLDTAVDVGKKGLDTAVDVGKNVGKKGLDTAADVGKKGLDTAINASKKGLSSATKAGKKELTKATKAGKKELTKASKSASKRAKKGLNQASKSASKRAKKGLNQASKSASNMVKKGLNQASKSASNMGKNISKRFQSKSNNTSKQSQSKNKKSVEEELKQYYMPYGTNHKTTVKKKDYTKSYSTLIPIADKKRQK